jgi:hypothetical protein
VQVIERLLTDLIPLFVEVFLGEVSAEQVLTRLTLLQIVSLGVVCGSLLSRSADYGLGRQLLMFGYFWLLACLTVLLWIFGWVVLHGYGAN